MTTTDKRALIIGAAGGIGSALTTILAERGWELVLAGRNADAVEALARQTGQRATSLDATDFDAVASAFADFGPFTGAVNLAGSILLKPAHTVSSDDFTETIDLNLRTAFAVTRAAGRAMKQTGGSVVLMSSCAATVGLANHEAIAAAKAGVEGLVRSAAATYAPSGIRFNAVAPGLVDTPMASRITGNDAALKASIAMHPLGRIGEPADISRAIAMLLDPDSAWITGQILGVDGGLARLKTR